MLDKLQRREVLPKGAKANALQLFDDRPFAHDAWDIDFNVEEVELPGPEIESMKVVEQGPLRAVVRVTGKTERSTLTQDITLGAGSARLEFVTRVDWHEKKALLRVAFPVAVRSRKAAFEIQFAAIERATHRSTAFDAGRHEVAAQRWADLSEGNYGVALLNDCKYGYDVRDNVLRLSLLRATTEPDPVADQGEHEFTYALYPHGGDWRNGTVQEGAELNMPLLAVPVKAGKGPLPDVYALASVDAEHVVIDSVKKAEDSDALVVRVYEACGQRGEVTLTFGHPVKSIAECDLMEENDVPLSHDAHSVRFFIAPYEIRTFKVAF
jgi:alpha-mannosidase